MGAWIRMGMCAAALTVALCGGRAAAAEYGQHHYMGTDGLLAGSLYSPGFHANMRVIYAYQNRAIDHDGNKRYYKRETFFVEPELIWSSCAKILGARYEARIAVPLASHIEDMALKDNVASRNHVTLKTGDLRVTPILLGWSWDRFDLTAGYTFFAPTGDFDYKPLNRADKADRPNSGKGYWTHMLNLGGTFYLDDARTWHISMMTHYERHTRQDDSRIRYGDNLHAEWGVGKDLGSWRVGAVGYASFQTTDDDVPGVKDDGAGNRVLAAGLEVGYRRPAGRIPWFATVRGAQEFSVKGNLRGFRSMLTAGLDF